jgi:hypothetical protein
MDRPGGMSMINKYKWPIILVIAAVAAGSYFYLHFYARGINALLIFSASYERFDRAISEFSLNRTDDLGRQAGEALSDLQARSTFRLSSLIRNDGALMDQAREIAGLARTECENLQAYSRASRTQAVGMDRLAEELSVLSEKRKAAFARFKELGGIKERI